MRWCRFHWMLWKTVCRPGPRLCILLGLLALGPSFGTPAAAQPDADSAKWVRVRLHHQATLESARLTPEGDTLAVVLPSEDAPILELAPDDTVTLGRRQADVYAQHDGARLYAQSLRLAPVRSAAWTLTAAPASPRTYSGSLRLRSADAESGIQMVNRVSLSDYVASVVASEYGLNDRAGTRAMAVVARTYGLFSTKGTFGGEYDHVDGTASQVYRGRDAITDAARRAATHTRGQILTHSGTPIQAVYFSSSGGHTASNEHVWTDSDPLPYLRGKEDPYDRASPHHRWTTRVDRRPLLRALSLHEGASVEGFVPGDRSPEGRLRTIDVLLSDDTDATIEADTFRSVVEAEVNGAALKSAWFDARREGSDYVFEGRGHGHGVGLNQWGAHAMAEQGKSYREILSFYYTGVQIQQLDDTSSPPPLAEDPATEMPDSTSTRIGW
jgi:stage II sporulation protein D